MRGVWWVVALAACRQGGDARGAAGPDDGQERGACYGNGTCDPGLLCYSDRCVRPPGADCAAVGEKLSGYRLDNYAPRDERRRVIDELAAMCRDARLTEDEGACIVAAQGRAAIAACPRPLLPELAVDPTGCGGFGAHVTRLVVEEFVGKGATRAAMARWEAELAATLDASCREDGWSEAGRRCVLDATTLDGSESCDGVIPRETQRRARDRLAPLLQRIEAELP